MRIKLSHKFLAANISVIVVLVVIFLTLSYWSNKTLLSNAMNGVDEKALDLLSVQLSDHYRKMTSWDDLITDKPRWDEAADKAFFQVFFSLMPPQPAVEPVSVAPSVERSSIATTKMCDPPFGTFLQRLSLLDANKNILIAAEIHKEDAYFQAIKLQGKVIGWLRIGKINMDVLPLATQFFTEQLFLTIWASILGGVIATILSILLARHINASVQALTYGSAQIAARNFQHFVEVDTRDELHDLAQSFNQISGELKRYEALQKQWLMDISHELRTPLTILIGEIASICDNLTRCDINAIESLQEEVLHIKRLVDDLHDLSNLDKRDFGLEKQPVDFAQIVDFQLKRYCEKLKLRKIQCSMNLSLTPVVVSGDHHRLSQVLMNLLENALRYTESPGNLWVQLSIESDMAVLVLEDSGPGVPTEALEKIFDRLFRGDGSRSRVTGGSGLGLSICKNIILAHDGIINASHSSKGGLCIRIKLPLARLVAV